MSQLPENASARLSMLEGNLCSLAELSMYLEQFGYLQDPSNQLRYEFASDGAAEGSCALVIENDGEGFIVYGVDSDHFTSLNYVMGKAGWTTCSVLSATDDIEAKLLSRLVSVEVSSNTANVPASSLRSSAADQRKVVTSNASPSASFETERHLEISANHGDAENGFGQSLEPTPNSLPLLNLEEDHQRIETLTIRANTFEERAEGLASANEALVESNRLLLLENETLKQKLQTTPQNSHGEVIRNHGGANGHSKNSPADSQVLIDVIETFLSSQLNLADAGTSPLLIALRNSGYEVGLRLTKSSSVSS